MHLGIAIDVILGYPQLYGHANVAERIADASRSRALDRITGRSSHFVILPLNPCMSRDCRSPYWILYFFYSLANGNTKEAQQPRHHIFSEIGCTNSDISALM